MPRMSRWWAPVVALWTLGCAGEVDEMTEASEALTGSAWVITSIVIVDGDGAETDVLEDWPDCARDNELDFSDDGTFTLTEGASACSVPVSEAGTWELASTEDAEVGDLITDVLLQSGEPVGFGLHHRITNRTDSEWTMELDRFDGTPGIVRYVIAVR